MVKRRIWLSPVLLLVSLLPITQIEANVTVGTASYYGGKFDGRRTASGARFNQYGLTAAHRTLSFGTRVLVTNKSNGRSVEVTINDRGPYVGGRMIDLSKGAAREIGMLGSGVARVELAVVGRGEAAGEDSLPELKVAAAQQILMDLF